MAEAFELVCRRRASLQAPLLVVTHGLVIHALLARHLRLADPHTLPERLRNTSLTAFGAEAPHVVDLLDCTVHLHGDDVDKAASLSGG